VKIERWMYVAGGLGIVALLLSRAAAAKTITLEGGRTARVVSLEEAQRLAREIGVRREFYPRPAGYGAMELMDGQIIAAPGFD
jgi:hypothetical protein